MCGCKCAQAKIFRQGCSGTKARHSCCGCLSCCLVWTWQSEKTLPCSPGTVVRLFKVRRLSILFFRSNPFGGSRGRRASCGFFPAQGSGCPGCLHFSGNLRLAFIRQGKWRDRCLGIYHLALHFRRRQWWLRNNPVHLCSLSLCGIWLMLCCRTLPCRLVGNTWSRNCLGRRLSRGSFPAQASGCLGFSGYLSLAFVGKG